MILDRDGIPDVVVANRSGPSLRVLRGTGQGKLAAGVDYAANSPWALALADLNGDDKLDVVAINQSASMSVWLGSGDGKLGAEVSNETSPLSLVAGYRGRQR